MTENEFKLAFDEYLSTAFSNRTTMKTYRAAAHRLVLRVPVEAWADPDSIRVYRTALSPTMRGKLGTILQHAFSSVSGRGVPTIDYSALVNAFAVPETMADAIDVLSVATSFHTLSTLRWGDVPSMLGTLGDRERRRLASIMEYVWGEAEPDADAPVIPLSRAMRHIPMASDIMEALVTNLSDGWSNADERVAYATYLALADAERPLVEIDEVMGWFRKVDADVSRYDRPKAFSVAGKAVEDLKAGDLVEFVAKWDTILRRVDKQDMTPDDRYRWFRETRPPADEMEVTVSVGPVEVGADSTDDAPRKFGKTSDPVDQMPEWRKALRTSNDWLHKVIAKS